MAWLQTIVFKPKLAYSVQRIADRKWIPGRRPTAYELLGQAKKLSPPDKSGG
ncbi:MAG: hypothetical protein JW837_12060 [Sedimentisphaerales bacterium]|nr:hypothetical protein [Sedimentisphaerales bacterium]